MPEQDAIAKALSIQFGYDEGIFYLVLFGAAAAATLFRSLSNSKRRSYRSLFGRCCTGGLIGSGVVAIWLGSWGHINDSGYYYAFASALIGFFNEEIQARALNPLIDMVLDFVERFLGGNKRRIGEKEDSDSD